MITNTIAVEEVLWLLAALPGLYLWAGNTVVARRTLREARRAGIGNGRLLWAKFSVFLTGTMVVVSFGYVVVGVIAMFRVTNPDSAAWSRLVVVGVLVGASVALSFLALRWRQVDEAIVEAAHLGRVAAEAQQVRGLAQDARSLEQDTRSMRQSERGVGQDERGAEQDAHGIELDERERHIREQGDE